MLQRHGLLLLLLVSLTFPGQAGEKDYAALLARAYDEAPDEQKARWEALSKTPQGLALTGRYREALDALKSAGTAEGLALAGDVLIATGRYEDAEKLLSVGLDVHPADPNLLAVRGDVRQRLGRLADALADYRAACTDMGADPESGRMRARLALVELLDRLGRRDEVVAESDWFFTYYMNFQSDDAMSVQQLYYIGAGAVAGGEFQDGLRVMAAAQRRDPEFLAATLRIGRTFATKYQYGDAAKEFEAVLRLNPRSAEAHAALAHVMLAEGNFDGADEHAQLALAVNPRLAEAHLALATMDLIDDDVPGARKRLEAALQSTPHQEEVLRFLAALARVEEDEQGYRELRERLLSACAIGPAGDPVLEAAQATVESRMMTDVAGVLESVHRVEEALALARKAVEIDPQNAGAWSKLGISLMRNGLEDEAPQVLDRAFQLDPYNVWIYNLRKLVQRDQQYDRIQTQRFLVKLFEAETAALEPYMRERLDAHLTHCETLFGVEAHHPVVKLTMLKSHADFSARITGLPHLDASGATFGPFVALVSPDVYRRRNDALNWDSVALHEIAHVVTLSGSRYRIPRWLGEGMSVYAEGWITHDWDIPLKTEIESGHLPDLRTWNRQFHRPDYAWQIAAAYHGAGKFVEWLVEEHGKEVLPQLIQAYGEDRETEEICRSVLGRDVEEVNAWLGKKLQEYAAVIDCPAMADPSRHDEVEAAWKEHGRLDDALLLLRIYRMVEPQKAMAFAEELLGLRGERPEAEQSHHAFAEAALNVGLLGLQLGRDGAEAPLRVALELNPRSGRALFALASLAQKKTDAAEAEALLSRSIDAYPRFVDDGDNPYRALANLLVESDRKEKAIDLLERFWSVRRDDPGMVRQLAQLYAELGRKEEAVGAYRRLFGIDPYVAADHTACADLMQALGDEAGAAREREVAQAMTKAGTDAAGDDDRAAVPQRKGPKPTTAPEQPKADPVPEAGPSSPSQTAPAVDPRLQDVLQGL